VADLRDRAAIGSLFTIHRADNKSTAGGLAQETVRVADSVVCFRLERTLTAKPWLFLPIRNAS
jgi:hypothetical protein